MEILPQTIANGIIIGGTYALMAIGLTLVFGFMDLVNFAHGELYMLGAYFAFTFIVGMGMPYLIGLPLAAAAVMVLGYLLDRVLFRPLRGQDTLVRMLTTVGLSIILPNLAIIIWNPVPKRVPIPIQANPLVLGSVRLAPVHLMVVLVAFAVIVAFHLFLQYTKGGTAMRATFQDPEVAAAMGIDIDRIYGYTFAIGVGMAAIGGALLSMVYIIMPTMGSMATMKAFAVVILGGLGNFMGAIVGALIIGISETLAATYASTGYKDGVAFLLLVLILLVKPSGILGKARGVE
ncbi:MAG: branched-chain amino acid ABC transporter permease [Actinobacteria bacterium]|nr:branched-chain amino acid ABC transporter permease [Actinomycetota bacterium]